MRPIATGTISCGCPGGKLKLFGGYLYTLRLCTAHIWSHDAEKKKSGTICNNNSHNSVLSTGHPPLHQLIHTTSPKVLLMNKHKADSPNNFRCCLGHQVSSFNSIFFLVYWLSFFSLLSLSNNVTYPQHSTLGPSLYPTHALHYCCESMLAGWQQVPHPKQQRQPMSCHHTTNSPMSHCS